MSSPEPPGVQKEIEDLLLLRLWGLRLRHGNVCFNKCNGISILSQVWCFNLKFIIFALWALWFISRLCEVAGVTSFLWREKFFLWLFNTCTFWVIKLLVLNWIYIWQFWFVIFHPCLSNSRLFWVWWLSSRIKAYTRFLLQHFWIACSGWLTGFWLWFLFAFRLISFCRFHS